MLRLDMSRRLLEFGGGAEGLSPIEPTGMTPSHRQAGVAEPAIQHAGAMRMADRSEFHCLLSARELGNVLSPL